MADPMLRAMANRSIRTIKTELDFLVDSALITPDQLSTILSQLPSDASMRAAHEIRSTTSTTTQPIPTPASITTPLSNLNLHEKQPDYYGPSNQPTPAPIPSPAPAYTQAPHGPPPLIYASASYAYNPTDANDLGLMPNDRIAVLEYMNDDWWRGRNERTGQEGIFPRSYVREAPKGPPSGMLSPPPQMMQQPSGPASYGNMPMGMVQGPDGVARIPSKTETNMRKFGSKLGNAAIFGAGATLGSDIVNSIF